eukprot:g34870.t1
MAEEIVEALVVIFEESLDSGTVPEEWKMANVTPLFKKGERQKNGNYRLVSLTSVVSKILEYIMKDEIAEHLEVHDNTKIGGETVSVEEARKLQKDLDGGQRSGRWNTMNQSGKPSLHSFNSQNILLQKRRPELYTILH